MYDLIIKNTKIVDGTGKNAFMGDISIKDSIIVEVGRVEGTAGIIINGTGLVTCPGFIDPHCHPDMTFSIIPLCNNFIMQGVTTAIGGNCGLTEAPKKGFDPKESKKEKFDFEGFQTQRSKKDLTFGKWLKKVERRGLSINFAPLVGHNPIRSFVMGDDFKRHARPDEIEAMKQLVEDGMKSGAFGFSTDLDYDPSEYGSTDEIIELAKVAKKYGGIYASHLRHCQSQWATNDLDLFGYGVFHGDIEEAWMGKYQGVMEAFEVGRKADIPIHLSHMYTIYLIHQPHPEFLDEATTKATLWNIDKAIEEGLDVTFDIIVSDTSISPSNLIVNEFILSRLHKLRWLREYDAKTFLEQLKSDDFREKIKDLHRNGYLKLGMIHTKAHPYWMNCFKITKFKRAEYQDKTIGELATKLDKDALDLVLDLMLEDPEVEWIQFDEDRAVTYKTLPLYLSHRYCMPCTDMTSLPPVDLSVESLKSAGTGIPEEFLNSLFVPHYYGMYADYIGRFVRETRVLTLENAIRKATSFVAQRFGIKNRGEFKSGYFADILIFDFDKIKMTGDIKNARQAPDGIKYVLVNGQITYKDKKHTGIKAGKVLRHEMEG